MEKITIIRGLTTLKTLDKKISKAIRNGKYVSYEVNGKSDTDLTAVSDLQKVNDLIDYRDSLKKAISVSNSKTMVKIGKEEMLVTEDETKYRVSQHRSRKTA